MKADYDYEIKAAKKYLAGGMSSLHYDGDSICEAFIEVLEQLARQKEKILELISVVQQIKPKSAGEHEYLSILMHEAERLVTPATATK